MSWKVPKIWEGGDVWILGGGPSLTQQFDIPTEVVQRVMRSETSPSAYSPYMEAIHKKHVIGINVAFLIGEWLDMVFFGDNKFLLANKDDLALWPGLKVSCYGGSLAYPWIKYLPKNRKKGYGISSDSTQVSWNGNSGAAAISVAANAGAKRIILVGFDMKLNERGNQHWHTLYKNFPDKPVRPGNKDATFTKHLIGFPAIAKDAKARGIEIINASPNSAITDFRKCSVKELL